MIYLLVYKNLLYNELKIPSIIEYTDIRKLNNFFKYGRDKGNIYEIVI